MTKCPGGDCCGCCAGYSWPSAQEARALAVTTARWHVGGARMEGEWFLLLQLWEGALCPCSTFLLCRARISWDSCFSDPHEGEGRVPTCWFPVQIPHTDDPRPGSKVDSSDQRKPQAKGMGGIQLAWGGTVNPTESALPGGAPPRFRGNPL